MLPRDGEVIPFLCTHAASRSARHAPPSPRPPAPSPRSTGRKRRCGWFDAVVVRYSHTLNSFTSLNITKLDVLDALEEVRIGVAYRLDGELLPPGAFPSTLEDLARVEVVYETMPGWKCSTAGMRRFKDLPPQAQAYVLRLEAVCGVPVAWIGTGVGRHDMITRGFSVEA